MSDGALIIDSITAGVPVPSGLGAPSVLPPDQVEPALETIEFGAVLEAVAGFAAGPLGADRVRARRPAADVAWIRNQLAMVAEVAALARQGDPLTAQAAPDARPALARLRVDGSVLEARDLAQLRRLLGAARATAAELRRVAERAPLAAALDVPLPERRVDHRLDQAVDDGGELLDSASPRLAAARREVHAARQRLIRRLESLLRSLDPQAAPTDATVTMRNGRYVIPVRRDSRARPGGIVHDESGSHGTLFVEPAEAVELGNALREAEVAEERETLRVLRELTELLRPDHPLLRAAFEMCVAVDDLCARARYAVAVGAERPEVAAAPAPLDIRTGRHPLLLAQAALAHPAPPVIPFDLALDGGERTLLISGPNTGGKTVLLKATALCCALAQAGIIPPVGGGSRLPVFQRFFADIGDRQSIAASLSTFSAHVAMLRQLLAEADDASLVLLDEVGSGTDPAEGAALAEAALVALTRRGTITLATTHLGSLKTLAGSEPGVVNASLHFDAATLTPTYRFAKGLPGRSYGLAIARRLGIPGDVLADAERRVPEAERSLDRLLAAVEQRDRDLRERLAAAESRALELESLAARLARQAEDQAARGAELARREKDAERAARRQAREFLLEARQRVEEALAAARAAVDEAEAREARRLVEEGIRAERERLGRLEDETARPGRTAAPAAAGRDLPLAVGARVRLPSGATGLVVETRGEDRVVVAVGAMKLTARRAEVTVLAGEAGGRAGARGPAPAPAALDAGAPAAPMEIDLRGLTGDEAEQATLAALDAAVLAEHPWLRIIHGMGTGVVRDRVRRVVQADRRVRKVEFAPRAQGGTGVTIVEFAD